MREIGYYNGVMGDLRGMQCPITDRAVYFGDGCYDTTYVKRGVPFALDEHLDRFYNNCSVLRIPIQYTKSELKKILYRLIEKFGLDGTGMLYWQVSRGSDVRYHSFPDAEKVFPNIMAFLVERRMTTPEREYSVISVEDTRYRHCNVKTLNQLPSVMAVQKAKDQGCKEAIFVRDGKVTEMAHSNISFLIDGVLVYHPFDWKILPGISVKHLIELAKKKGIPTKEKELTIEEAIGADELIVTSSGVLCNRIISCDGRSVGGKDERTYNTLQRLAYDEFERYTMRGI